MKIKNGTVTIPLTELERIKSVVSKKDKEIKKIKEELKKSNIALKEFAKGKSTHVIYETAYQSGWSEIRIITTDEEIPRLVQDNNKLIRLLNEITHEINGSYFLNRGNVIRKIRNILQNEWW